MDIGAEAAEELLETLVDAHLLETAPTPGRYRFHDLLRLYAREWLEREATDAYSCLQGPSPPPLPPDGSPPFLSFSSLRMVRSRIARSAFPRSSGVALGTERRPRRSASHTTSRCPESHSVPISFQALMIGAGCRHPLAIAPRNMERTVAARGLRSSPPCSVPPRKPGPSHGPRHTSCPLA